MEHRRKSAWLHGLMMPTSSAYSRLPRKSSNRETPPFIAWNGYEDRRHVGFNVVLGEVADRPELAVAAHRARVSAFASGPGSSDPDPRSMPGRQTGLDTAGIPERAPSAAALCDTSVARESSSTQACCSSNTPRGSEKRRCQTSLTLRGAANDVRPAGRGRLQLLRESAG